MNRILIFLLAVGLASCHADPDRGAPPYEIAGFQVNDATQESEYRVLTPRIYSRDSIVRVAQAVRDGLETGTTYTIRFYDGKTTDKSPYCKVVYNDGCAGCAFNAKDPKGRDVRVDLDSIVNSD